MIIYLGMVTLSNPVRGVGLTGYDNVVCASFNKESVKTQLVEEAGKILKEFGSAWEVKTDFLDPEAILLECNVFPKKIKYWIKETEVIN